ncbi:MAG: LPP20 family lipoprotein [Candidatus Cloacimonadaceae bacterium]|jgi:hypothetical protein
MSNRYLFGALIILAALVAGCSSNAKIPAWVSDTNTDNDYYHAIVSVPKYDSRYKERAFEQAVQNISMQISVNVDASVSTQETEAFGISHSDFSSNIQTSSRTHLKDVELYRSEENKLGYWAHYRLNKSRYRLQRLQQAKLGKQLASDLIQKYDLSLKGKRFEFLKSSLYLIKALDELSDLIDMDLTAELYETEVNLYTEALHRLATLAANTKLIPEHERIDAITGSKLNLTSTITCHYEGDSTLDIMGLRLRAAFDKGSGSVVESFSSNPLGEAQLEIQSIDTADKYQSISVAVDKLPLLEQSENPLVKKIISNLNFSSISLPLVVRSPRVWLDYSFNEDSSQNQRLIEDRLRELALEVVDDKEAADYILQVELKSRPGYYINLLGIYSAFGDAFITLRNAHTLEVLGSDSIKDIKATAPTKSRAAQATETATLRVVNQELLSRLVKLYIQP